jgi:hypothetical protein
MRTRHAIVIVATILLAVAVKVFFLTPAAVAEIRAGAGLNVSHMHENITLPVQAVHDMTFVYSHGD